MERDCGLLWVHILHGELVTQKRQICYILAIKVGKSHRPPHCTSQLVCEDRVLFVWVDLHFSYAGSSMQNASSSSANVSTYLLLTSRFVQPHKQKPNAVMSENSNCSISTTIQGYTHVHMNDFSRTDRSCHLPQYWHFLLCHPAFDDVSWQCVSQYLWSLSNYSNQKLHVKRLKGIHTYTTAVCFGARAPSSGNPECEGVPEPTQQSCCCIVLINVKIYRIIKLRSCWRHYWCKMKMWARVYGCVRAYVCVCVHIYVYIYTLYIYACDVCVKTYGYFKYDPRGSSPCAVSSCFLSGCA